MGSTPPPINPDGTPILTTPANTGVVGTATIYDWLLPPALDPNKRTIWYDVGTRPIKPPDWMIVAGNTPKMNEEIAKASLINYGSATSAEYHQPQDKTGTETFDHMVTPAKIMQTVASLSITDPKAFTAIQTYLSSGVWGTVHVNGSFDHETEVALGNAMLQWSKLTRNADLPIDFQQYIAQAGTQALQLQGASGPQAAPIQVTDPDTIKEQAQIAAQNALGHTLSESELNSFVSEFQGAQRTYQTTNQGVISSPDLTTEADKFAQQSHPAQFKQNNESAYYDQLVNLLSTGAQRPNQAPVAPVS